MLTFVADETKNLLCVILSFVRITSGREKNLLTKAPEGGGGSPRIIGKVISKGGKR